MKLRARLLLSLSLCVVLSACSGSDTSIAPPNNPGPIGSSPEGEALFAVSGKATPNQIHGVWQFPPLIEGNLRIDSRMDLAPDYVELAAKCSESTSQNTVVADARTDATVTNDRIAIHSSKTDAREMDVGGRPHTCRASLDHATTQRCSFTPYALCFELSGTTLTFYDARSETLTLTKVSD